MFHPAPDREFDRNTVVQWAADLMANPEKWVVLDTETTGLDLTAEIIQIGVLDPTGKVLLDQLVRPQGRIAPEAQAVHGITDEMVATATPFPQMYEKLVELIRHRRVIIFNANFDRRLIYQCVGRYPGLVYESMTTVCAMLQFSQWIGDWNEERGNYRWKRLPIFGEHTAIGDCQEVLRLIKQMAESFNPLWDGPKPVAAEAGFDEW